MRLTNFDVLNGSTAWNGVSVAEFEAYTNEQTVNETLDSVISKLNRMGDQTVEAGATEVALPQVPAGFKVELNGADFEQVIGDDRSVHHPLTDKLVKVSWKVSKEGTDEKAVTNDIVYHVKGVNTQPADKNVKPSVVPEIQEWYSDSDAKLDLDALAAVTYSDDTLKPVVDEFVADYKDFTGRDLASSRGEVKAGTIHFTLASPADDALLGDEGYVMEIEPDRINVTAPAVTGNMYAMQTILQMTKTSMLWLPSRIATIRSSRSSTSSLPITRISREGTLRPHAARSRPERFTSHLPALPMTRFLATRATLWRLSPTALTSLLLR